MRFGIGWTALLAAGLAFGGSGVQAQDEARWTKPRTNQQGADFRPPSTKEAWLKRREEVRSRILVSTGLYPLPERTPLNPRVYGRLQRDGYTIEKVVLETLPGFYLSGNLYRPAVGTGRVPGILNPHGHWREGRIAGDVQARCIGQARMGAVAFLYDMVGYVDSRDFGHAFMDDELATLGFNLPGLQLWNSIRALDFLLSLPEVDPERVACTGESGGGTQTFLLGAVDDRVKVAAPVCMVSHHFQGGCSCENAPLLRVGTDNVEFAALFAPKPQMLVGATGDWTSQIMERGVPEIRAVYRLYGQPQNFEAVLHTADHNYNQQSRESVYTFLRKHLWGDRSAAAVREAPFTAEEERVISTWDAEHPRPADASTPDKLKAYLRTVRDRQVEALGPRTSGQWQEARKVLHTALRSMTGARLPADGEIRVAAVPAEGGNRLTLSDALTGNKTTALMLGSGKDLRRVTVVVHPAGPAGVPASLRGAGNGEGYLLLQPALAGQPDLVMRRQASQYFSTYNPTILADRVQEVLTAVAYARTLAPSVNLVGLAGAGPWVLLARPLAGEAVARTAADAAGWEWPAALPVTSEMALPGARRYGGMKALAALSAPSRLFVYGTRGLDTSWLREAYALEGGKLRVLPGAAAAADVAEWLAD